MIATVSADSRKKAIEYEKDFYKSELINRGYFKSPDGRQLYELSLDELREIYHEKKQEADTK